MDPQISFIVAIQSQSPGLAPFFSAVAFLGLPEFYLLFIPLILWCYDRSLGVRLLLLLSISGAVSDALKIAFHSPRPYWVSTQVRAFAYYPSFGFPSAHAQNAVVFFGLIAATVRRMWVVIVCIAIVLLIGLARVFQGVHYPTDILGGYVAGVVLLLLFLRYETPVAAWVKERPLRLQLSVAFAASLAFVGISLLVLLSLGSWQVPAGWSALALAQSGVPIDPLVPSDTLLSAGILFGSASGAAVSARYIPFTPEGTMVRKVARYMVGVVILFVILAALGYLVHTQSPGGLVMVFIRAAAAGFWITAGAPFLFRKAGLAGAS